MTGSAQWLGRFVEVVPLSSNGAFRITACLDAPSGRSVVVVTADPAADMAAARVALRHLHHAHSAVEHFAVARASRINVDADAEPHVVFDIPARYNLEGLLRVCRGKPEHRVEHAEGDAFTYYLREGLSAAHEHKDLRDGAPLCIGALSQSGVLFAPDGRFWLVGLGHNIAACDEHGDIDGRAVFAAPEVVLGARATPIGDYIALLKLGRSVMKFSRLAPQVMAVVKGADTGKNLAELVKHLLWIERRVLGAVVSERATVPEAIEVAHRIRAILQSQPDLDGFKRAVAKAFNSDSAQRGRVGPMPCWEIAGDGSWLARSSQREQVPSKPMQRILLALVRMRNTRPGERLSVEALFEEGWPGERVRRRAAANRVYVAINGLRGLGLGEDLESKRGYRLSLTVPWRKVDL